MRITSLKVYSPNSQTRIDDDAMAGSHERDERAVLPMVFVAASESSILFLRIFARGIDGGWRKERRFSEAFIARLTELKIAANRRS